MNNTVLNDLNRKSVRKVTDNRAKRKSIRWIGITIIFIIVILTFIFTAKTATATNDSQRIKQVTSVRIEKGDTLWSIASRFMSCEYKDLNEYVEEIMSSNGLTSDQIHAGNYIIVPYYTDKN